MSKLEDEVRALVRRDGVVSRRASLELNGSVEGMVKAGELVPVLPGVDATRDASDDFRVRVAALRCWSPDAVLTGAAAARLTFWPSVPVEAVGAAVRRRGQHPGFRLVTRTVPPELVLERHGPRMTAPALTALDLCDERVICKPTRRTSARPALLASSCHEGRGRRRPIRLRCGLAHDTSQ